MSKVMYLFSQAWLFAKVAAKAFGREYLTGYAKRAVEMAERNRRHKF